MIRLYNRYHKIELIVYENEEEFKASKHECVDVLNCKPGDYIHTDNGYYVPVINRFDFHPKAKVNSSYFINILLPGSQRLRLQVYKDNGLRHSYHIVWYRERPQNYYQGLGAQHIMMLNFLELGMGIYEAYRAAFTNKARNVKEITSQLLKVFYNPKFIQILKERDFMSKLTLKLKEAGLTEDAIVEGMANDIKDLKPRDRIGIYFKLLEMYEADAKASNPLPQDQQLNLPSSREELLEEAQRLALAESNDYELLDEEVPPKPYIGPDGKVYGQ